MEPKEIKYKRDKTHYTLNFGDDKAFFLSFFCEPQRTMNP